MNSSPSMIGIVSNYPKSDISQDHRKAGHEPLTNSYFK